MSIDVFAVAGPSISTNYYPVSIVAVTVPVPITLLGFQFDVKYAVFEEIRKGMLDGKFEDVDHSVTGHIFRDDERGGYGYNVWHNVSSGIGGGWNEAETFEDDVETFKRFPSCILLMEHVFYQRIQRMATAVGSNMHRFDFHKPELLRAA